MIHYAAFAMRALLAFAPLVAWRAGARWPALLALGAGILAAASLLAAAPLYARSMSSLAASFSLRSELGPTPTIEVLYAPVQLGNAGEAARFEVLAERSAERLGWMAKRTDRALVGPRFFLQRGEEPEERPFVVQLRGIERLEERVVVVEGSLQPEAGAALPLVLSTEVAEAAELGVGSRVQLVESFDTCARELPTMDSPPPPPCHPTATVTYTTDAVVVALVELAEGAERLWPGGASGWLSPAPPLPETRPVLPGIVPYERLHSLLLERWPGYPATPSDVFVVDPDRVDAETRERVRADVQALRSELDPFAGFVLTPMLDVLERVAREQPLAEGATALILLQLAAVAVYFVYLVATATAQRDADELALLRSRGASIQQIIGLELAGSAFVALPAILLGPLVATVAIASLGYTPLLPEPGGALPVRPTLSAYGFAAAGGLGAVGAMLLPVALVARRSAVGQRRAEARPQPPALQRYYLDLAFVAVVALLVWELDVRGSVFAPDEEGKLATDPVLLAIPALMVAAGAILVLRLYPLAARAGQLLGLARSAVATLATWRASRHPGPYARLALLLMMAVAVGTYAASYGRTVERSYRERALFEVPADVVAALPADAEPEAVELALEELPEVGQATLVYRARHNLAAAGSAGRTVQVLAVDPEEAEGVLWFRSDFASRNLRELFQDLQGPTKIPGLHLPEDAVGISIWANSAVERESVTLWARVRDATGRYALLELGKLDVTGWRELRASLEQRFGRLEPPVELVALVLTEPPNRFSSSDAPLYIDDLAAVRADGSLLILDDFERNVSWDTLPTVRPAADAFEYTEEESREGKAGAFRFRIGVTGERRGIFVRDVTVPLPVLASRTFVANTGIGRGGTALLSVGQTLVPFVVRDIFEHFPTLPTEEGPALVFNRDQLFSWVGAFDFSPTGMLRPTEVWLDLGASAWHGASEQLKQALEAPPFRLLNVRLQERAVAEARANPALGGGGAGILSIAYVASLVLVAIAFVVALSHAAVERRVEFAVLRALGFSRFQVLRLFATEHLFLVVAGAAAGVGLGLLVSLRSLAFLNVDARGNAVEPPFILSTDWDMVMAGGLAVIVLLFLGVATAGFILARTPDAEALRTE